MREKQLERINHKFTTETFKHCHVTAKHVRPVIRLNMPNQLHWEELAIIVVCEAQFIQSVWRSGGRPFVANFFRVRQKRILFYYTQLPPIHADVNSLTSVSP